MCDLIYNKFIFFIIDEFVNKHCYLHQKEKHEKYLQKYQKSNLSNKHLL